MKLIIIILVLFPFCAICQHRGDSLHRHNRISPPFKGDTLWKTHDVIEINLGEGIKQLRGWKILLHKMPQDTVIFTDEHYKIIPVAPAWEADTDWFINSKTGRKPEIQQ